MKFGNVILVMFAIVLIQHTSSPGITSAITKDVISSSSQKNIGKEQTINIENLNNNQGVFSDLQIIFCNASYNPCNGTDDLDYIRGDDGNNVIVGMNGNDNITSNKGNDEISGNGGNDIVAAGDGNDRILGGYGDDILYGNHGDDVMLGDKGNDHLYGDEGVSSHSNDVIAGGPGMDTIFGGSGNDKIFQNSEQVYSSSIGDGYRDRINCGEGNDEVWINVLDNDYVTGCEVIHLGTIASKTP